MVNPCLYRSWTQACASLTHEERLLVGTGQLWSLLTPACDRLQGKPAYRHDAVFVAFAGDMYRGVGHINIVYVEVNQLSKAQADYIGVSPDGPFKPDTYRY